MMKSVIHKFKLDKNVNHITVPEDDENFHLLHIDVQGPDIFAWVMIAQDFIDDPDSFEKKSLALVVIPTGETFELEDENEDWMYHRQTVMQGPYVWHIFESDQERHQPEYIEDSDED